MLEIHLISNNVNNEIFNRINTAISQLKSSTQSVSSRPSYSSPIKYNPTRTIPAGGGGGARGRFPASIVDQL